MRTLKVSGGRGYRGSRGRTFCINWEAGATDAAAHNNSHASGSQLPSSKAAYSSKLAARESAHPPTRQLPSSLVAKLNAGLPRAMTRTRSPVSVYSTTGLSTRREHPGK